MLIYCYCNQTSQVSFDGRKSAKFDLRNGVSQGKVLARFLYGYNCFELFLELKDSSLGCYVKEVFAGIFRFSIDDIAITPSFLALEEMMKIIEDFNIIYGLKISTNLNPSQSKIKCMAWLNVNRDLPNILLDGNKSPLVNKIKHLRNTSTNNPKLMLKD